MTVRCFGPIRCWWKLCSYWLKTEEEERRKGTGVRGILKVATMCPEPFAQCLCYYVMLLSDFLCVVFSACILMGLQLVFQVLFYSFESCSWLCHYALITSLITMLLMGCVKFPVLLPVLFLLPVCLVLFCFPCLITCGPDQLCLPC